MSEIFRCDPKSCPEHVWIGAKIVEKELDKCINCGLFRDKPKELNDTVQQNVVFNIIINSRGVEDAKKAKDALGELNDETKKQEETQGNAVYAAATITSGCSCACACKCNCIKICSHCCICRCQNRSVGIWYVCTCSCHYLLTGTSEYLSTASGSNTTTGTITHFIQTDKL